MKIYDYYGKTNIVGMRVRLAREKLDLSQEDLAAKLQTKNVMIGQKAVSRIEQQKRVVADYELLHLAEILNVDVLWLLKGDG